MYKSRTQTQQTNNRLVTIISIVIATVAVAYAVSAHRTVQMTNYAINNNCKWHYNGTAYGDNRDYTCKRIGS